MNYQKGARDKAAAPDLRNGVAFLQKCAEDTGGGRSLVERADAADHPGRAPFTSCPSQVPTTVSSRMVTSYFTSGRASPDSSTVTAAVGGSGKVYCFAGATGGPIAVTTTPVTAYRAACGRRGGVVLRPALLLS